MSLPGESTTTIVEQWEFDSKVWIPDRRGYVSAGDVYLADTCDPPKALRCVSTPVGHPGSKRLILKPEVSDA
ncbi:MAG TPA: hypothetical protein VMF31_10690 [Solirubrobacterales bacterium]|nr:hypothetical protein [Solirubrobacterales bacterium]